LTNGSTGLSIKIHLRVLQISEAAVDKFPVLQPLPPNTNSAWLAWELLTRSKKKGGLGFRDLHLFNLAMLARQAWRLLMDTNNLCAQVLKAKYFPNSSILQCKARGGISYSWRSILKGVQLLKKGIIWRIGSGTDTYIWKDPWIPRGYTRRPITPKGSSLLIRVSELIDPATGTWDELLIRDTFWPEDAEVILTIPTNEDFKDMPAWHFDSKGIFSVKSAYKLAVQIRDQELGQDASPSSVCPDAIFKWQKIWQLKLPHKINMFIWRMAHNSLPVKRNIVRRGIKIDTLCPVCKRFDEDCGHLFFKCKKAKECWQAMNLEHVRAELELCSSGEEIIMKILNLQQSVQNRVFIWLWRWWSARNKANAGEKMATIAEINSSVSFHLMEIEKLVTTCMNNSKNPSVKWKPPPSEFYKINVDASFYENSNQGGWGFVVRDCDGTFLEGGAGRIFRAASALQAEALGILKSLVRVADLGMTRIILETDSTIAGKAITSNDFDRSINGFLFMQIREFMASNFVHCIVNVCPRSCNTVADSLAGFGCTLEGDSCIYMSHPPDFVSVLVSGEQPETRV